MVDKNTDHSDSLTGSTGVTTSYTFPRRLAMASNESVTSVQANDLSAFLMRNDALGDDLRAENNLSFNSSSHSLNRSGDTFNRQRTLSVISVDSTDIRNYHTLCYMPLGTVHEWKRVGVYCRACLGLYGSIIYWVGAWDLVLAARPIKGIERHDAFFSDAFVPTPYRAMVYTIFGILICFLCDTLYGNAGMYSTIWDSEIYKKPHWKILRGVFAHIGSVFMWCGFYELIDCWMFPGLHRLSDQDDGYDLNENYTDWQSPYPTGSLKKNILCLLCGLVGLYSTGQISNMAYVWPVNFWDNDIMPFPKSSRRRHFKMCLIAIFSIFCQNLVWVGAWNLIHFYNSGMWRMVAYIVIGLLGFMWTNSFVNNSWIDCEEDFVVPEAERTFLFQARVLLALCAQVVHQAGFWDITEQCITLDQIPYDLRNILLLCIGLVMVAMAGSINAGVGINESYEDEEYEGMEQKENDEERQPLISG